jgi:hypothetical protein
MRNVCVMEGGLMDALGVGLGGTVRINSMSDWWDLRNLHFPPLEGIPSGQTQEELQAREEAFERAVDGLSVYYTVVGRVTSGAAPNTVFVPVTVGIEPVLSEEGQIFDFAEFTLASPRYAQEFRAFASARAVGTVGDIGSPFVMDMSEADNLHRTLGLLNALYPIAIAAAVAMAGLFPGLIVMQSDRVASIMRALGTTKRRTRAMFVAEQAALCAAGLLCATALLLAANGVVLALYTGTLTAYAALHLLACATGALACAVIITRRRVLELLQVKE